MNHTLYLSDKKPVCEEPERLGHDFVMNSTFPVCHDCSALLFAHNKRAAQEDEIAYAHNRLLHNEDPLAPARGIIYGLGLGMLGWLVIAGIVFAFYLAFFRG